MRTPVFVLAAASAFIALGTSGQAQPVPQWDVYVDQNNCADTRAGWLAVAKEHPGFGWTKMPGAPTSELFMEAIANMDAMRISGPFERYCCKFNVWRQSNPVALSLVREGEVAGPGWMIDSAPMCGETAILQFGMDDVLGALTVPIGSVPGATVTITANGPVSGDPTTPVVLPTNPPFTVSSPSINTVGDITGETGPTTPPPPPLGPTGGTGGDGGTPPALPGGDLPPGTVARVEGTFTLACTRVNMASFTYAGAMTLDFPDGGAIGTGTLTLNGGGELSSLSFAMQTQLMGGQAGSVGELSDPGFGVGSVRVTVIGALGGAPNGGIVPASGDIQVSIGMKARFANGQTPGDGSCTGQFAT